MPPNPPKAQSPPRLFFDPPNRQLLCLSPLQKLAVLKDGFQLDSGSQQELWGSSPSLANSEMSIPRLYSDAGSQTDIPAEVSPGGDAARLLGGTLTLRLCSVHDQQQPTGRESPSESEVRGGQEKVCCFVLTCAL